MDIVIFGTGEVADVFRYYLEQDGNKVVAHALDREYITEEFHGGAPVVAFEDLRRYFPPWRVEVYAGVSFKRINADREAICNRIGQEGYSLGSYVSPKAETANGLGLAANRFIMSHNVIQPFVEIGWDTILWNGNHVGHNTKIGNHCFIASHAVISGHVTIGENTFIGVNATIRDGITIGKRCVIGAGALVLHDLPDESVVSGVESKPRAMKSSELRSI